MLPADEYRSRLTAREALAARYDRVHVHMGNVRLLLFALAALMIWLVWARHLFSSWWLLAPVVAIVALGSYLDRLSGVHSDAERAAEFYRRGLARLGDRWAGAGESGERFRDPEHVYADDLDLFGKGSLFELLSTARTRMGEERLACWLLAPSPIAEIHARHEAVSELRDKLRLREELAVLGEEARVGVHPQDLLKWAEARPVLTHKWLRVLALVLAALAIAGAVIWGLYGLATPFLAVVLIEGGVAYSLRHRLEQITGSTENAFSDLMLLSSVLAWLEREHFTSQPMRALSEKLQSHHVPASHAIARLKKIVDFIDSRDNLLIRVLDIPLMYTVQVSYAAEAWRHEHGQAVRSWLDAVAEMEALLSLAGYSYEHPQDPLPEFVDGAASFAGEALGHPLIPAARCVVNDVKLSEPTRVLLVSGSNMSGKSTLLRTVGINTVLAMAGAPVRARALRLTPLQVGATIRINDSLQLGSSRFYAEITRLRRIVDLAGGKLPLLFLLDEVLQGTNSQDRRVGAEGLLRALVERGAIGLVTTHDLALAEITAALDGNLRNVHFQDYLEQGKMRFDYKLREGVVTKSNGLELMRSIGLEV